MSKKKTTVPGAQPPIRKVVNREAEESSSAEDNRLPSCQSKTGSQHPQEAGRSPLVDMPDIRGHRVSSAFASIVKTNNDATECVDEQPLPDVDDDSTGAMVRIFDPQAFVAALDEDDDWDDGGYIGPKDERPRAPPRSRSTEDEVWARVVRKIIADTQHGFRHLLIGDEAMAERLLQATATMPHFGAVIGIIHRAVVTSARTGASIRFPPICMLSEPGLGKTYLARTVASALGTSVVPIALQATLDRGQLSGNSTSWRGAKLGRLAKAILFDCKTASPIYLLDEIDKCSRRADDDVSSILLSGLEPENARAFVDEYIGVPVRLDHALWLASANVVETISPPLLSRLLVVEVPKPTDAQARIIVRAIAAAAVDCPIDDDAVDLVLAISARKARQAIEVAYPIMICAGRKTICADDVRCALDLVVCGPRRRAIGFTR